MPTKNKTRTTKPIFVKGICPHCGSKRKEDAVYARGVCKRRLYQVKRMIQQGRLVLYKGKKVPLTDPIAVELGFLAPYQNDKTRVIRQAIHEPFETVK